MTNERVNEKAGECSTDAIRDDHATQCRTMTTNTTQLSLSRDSVSVGR